MKKFVVTVSLVLAVLVLTGLDTPGESFMRAFAVLAVLTVTIFVGVSWDSIVESWQNRTRLSEARRFSRERRRAVRL